MNYNPLSSVRSKGAATMATIARLLLNQKVLLELSHAVVVVVQAAGGILRDIRTSRNALQGPEAASARLDTLEATVLRHTELTSALATQLQDTITAVRLATSRLNVALILAIAAACLSIASLLVTIL